MNNRAHCNWLILKVFFPSLYSIVVRVIWVNYFHVDFSSSLFFSLSLPLTLCHHFFVSVWILEAIKTQDKYYTYFRSLIVLSELNTFFLNDFSHRDFVGCLFFSFRGKCVQCHLLMYKFKIHWCAKNKMEKNKKIKQQQQQQQHQLQKPLAYLTFFNINRLRFTLHTIEL